MPIYCAAPIVMVARAPWRVLAGLAVLIVACVVTAFALRAQASPARRAPPADWPPVFAWTWNRDDDLRFLPPGAGIAAVQLSIELEGRQVRVRANHGRLTAPASAFVLPVVHIDAFERWRPALDAAQEDALVATIVAVGAHARSGAVQIDFEAAPSQRAFYRRVLGRVRARLPTEWVSITALASWCMDDRWTADLPVDDIVAMAFRLGRDAPAVRRDIGASARWPAAECTGTGLAVDEGGLRPPAHRSLFLFSPKPWTAAAWHATLAPLTIAHNE